MSISFDRTSIVRGAGTVKLDTTQMFSKGGISAAVETTWVDDQVDGYGNIDKTKGDQIVKASFTPGGQVSAAILSALYPYGATALDASCCGATDTAGEIHSMAGVKIQLPNAIVTQMPNLKLGAQETPFQQAEITGLLKKDTARSADGALYVRSSAAWSGTYSRAAKIKASYTGAWNGKTILAAEGWDIEFDLTLNPVMSADLGTIDYSFGGLEVRAKCRPINQSEDMWDNMLIQNDADAAIGASGRQSADLVITADISGGIDVTLKDAILHEGPMQWGENELRHGEIGFVATRPLPYAALFTVAVSAVA